MAIIDNNSGVLVPHLELYTREPQGLNRVLHLGSMIMREPSAFTVVHGRYSLEKQVTHRSIPGVTLRAVTATSAERPVRLPDEVVAMGPDSTRVVYSEVGVIEGSSEMKINVEHRRLKVGNNNASDPFIDLMLEYLDAHFGEPPSLVT